ncbi:peptidase S8/S53 domain-containing protein [Desarmillaria tabescens]|uniref:Peptidase S8/S53 domain-containing protein n=1 Tax=Armillaria tabescens TaxID=1929756 RepID=A0AA39KDX3_ARMTA|nr:peptidase S8/S53 domain-containing protein [Desarmillaria tabescens]KAK0459381.1 peptidase S8/S53 domain-containing protein [Desarmillaria tabescens]
MTFLICSSLCALSLAATVYASPLSTSSQHDSSFRSPLSLAPLIDEFHVHGSINDSYIVMLKDSVDPPRLQNHLNFLQMTHESDSLVAEFSGLRQVYDGHIKGYAGHFSSNVIDQLRRAPEVDFIEKDQIVKTLEIDTVGTSSVQRGAPWGLARISHRPRLTFGTFTKYEYDPSGGEGVDVYVIDTGINYHHDGNGHGSHCAGTIAGKTYGVAKQANVIAVKVLAGEAVQKAKAAEAEYKATGKTSPQSLGGGKSPSLDAAVNKAVDLGLHFAVAAGNDNKDACNYSPASAEKAVTVGASTLSDDRAYFSNHGKCVDVFAPGLNIKSTYKGSDTAVATLSGTSMASPHTFDPELKFDFVPADLQSQSHFSSSVYTIMHSAVPEWVANFLPSPKIPKSLTPKQLKAAVLDLASSGMLEDIPGADSQLRTLR